MMASKHAWKVDLIPWDFNSTDQINRLYEQRVACGWRSEEVPLYIEAARKGEKVFYWAVLTDQVPALDDLLSQHIIKYPNEKSPLTDTASEVCLSPRRPSGKSFIPVGHLALGFQTPDEDEKLGLPGSGVVWVHQVYISYALHRGGFGAAAMAKAEELATLPPFNASIMALDTAANSFQQNEVLFKIQYEDRGLPRPRVTNQEWYVSQGYEIFHRSKEEWPYTYPGGSISIEMVYLKKALR